MNCKELISTIAEEKDFAVYEISDFNVEDDIFIDFFLCTKDDFEYFIILNIEFRLIEIVNNLIQVAISTKIRAYLEQNEICSLNHYFDKNSTLIITTEKPNSLTSEEVYRVVSTVEENNYYFKKQVLYFTARELDIFLQNQSQQNSFTEKCSSVVSNLSRYEGFLLGLDEEYDFIARLYEKVPFLNLEVEKENKLNLDNMIAESLVESEIELLPELLELQSESQIDEWIKSIGEAND
ncbi:ABC-three component system middle component 1 [Pseudoalteromonas lipolytica]|uniref:ABC-three component system middle component 1 n=1 Tax=Pseudoalteromonas lipolytica TaxID=570156 RepID=UPI0008252007|nr:ABC-three component system middle component 1 [Pseudoalteromonas lipolytica]